MTISKFTFTFICSCLMTLQTFANIHSDEPITFEELPLSAQTFIQDNFAHFTVTRASYNTQTCERCYEVHLSDNTTLQFDEIGNWSAIEREDAEVPASMIAEEIKTFINENYPGAAIHKIEKEVHQTKVVLSSKEELVFDANYKIANLEDNASGLTFE